MWDNLSGEFDKAPDAASYEDCRSKCESDLECVQFSFSKGKCTTTDSPHWGEMNPDVQSGWFLDRVEKFEANMEPCQGEMWTTS